MDPNYSRIREIKQKVLRGGLIALLIASVPLCRGQDSSSTLNINDLNGIFLDNLSKNGKNSKAAGFLSAYGKASAIAGRREHENEQAELDRQAQLEAARILAGNTRQEQNNYQDEFFTCSYWRDLDGDDGVQTDEIVGKGKKRFDINEQIRIVGTLWNIRGKRLNSVIYGPDGSKIYKSKIETDENAVVSGISYEDYPLWKSLIQKNGTGNYLAAWYKDGKVAGTCEFEIYDKNEGRPKLTAEPKREVSKELRKELEEQTRKELEELAERERNK